MLVTHHCPTHGAQTTTVERALVYCSHPKCGAICAPEGVDPKEHEKVYMEARRQARLRRG